MSDDFATHCTILRAPWVLLNYCCIMLVKSAGFGHDCLLSSVTTQLTYRAGKHMCYPHRLCLQSLGDSQCRNCLFSVMHSGRCLLLQPLTALWCHQAPGANCQHSCPTRHYLKDSHNCNCLSRASDCYVESSRTRGSNQPGWPSLQVQ